MDNQVLSAENKSQTCPATEFQKVSVCVPVTIKPFAKAGVTETICCGNPVVKSGENKCNGSKNGTCTFTITQDICVKVPVEFGATSDVGDTFVVCKEASGSNICKGCGHKSDNDDEQ